MENHGFKNQRERLVLCDASSLYLEQFLSDFNGKTQQCLNSKHIKIVIVILKKVVLISN